MTCRELSDFILDYLSGDLAGETRQVFEAHLVECENCREYLATYKAAVQLGRSAFREADLNVDASNMPEQLVTAILAAAAKARSDIP